VTAVELETGELLALEGFRDGDDAIVYVSGSVVDGFGNAWSDVDVFAVVDRAPVGPHAQQASTNWTSQHLAGGRRYDWEFWRPEDVRALAERVDGLELGTGRHILGTAFLHIEQCFVHRLRTGLPVLNRDGLDELRARFDFDRFAAFQSEEAIRWLDAHTEDLCGMLDAHDAETALPTARAVVETAVDAYCHHRGSTDPVRKWRVKHVAALGEPALADEFWRLAFPDAALRRDWEACRRHCEASIRFAERLVASIQGS
jgi:hypothetical protein